MRTRRGGIGDRDVTRIRKQLHETLIGIDHIGLMQYHRILANPLRSADASNHMTLRTAGNDETRRTGDARSRLHISIFIGGHVTRT